MRKRAMGERVHHENKSDGGEFTIRKSDAVRVCHEKKSDGVRVDHEKKSDGVRLTIKKRAMG